jgi:GDPmannose 4,6-dehydratase
MRFDPRFLRPAKVEHLMGDSSKARDKLGWRPRVGFEEMVRRMVDTDLALLERGVPTQQAG